MRVVGFAQIQPQNAMPIVAIELSDETAEKVDAIANRELRSRKSQCLLFILEAVESDERKQKEEQQ